MSQKTVVRAFVFNQNGEVLMTRHKENAPWVLPGGHVEAGETLNEAMNRELQEEFSLEARFFDIDTEEILHHKGKKLTQFALPIANYELKYTDEKGKDKSRTEYIFLMETDEEIEETQVEEIFEYGWFEVDEILGMKPNIETWDFYIEMLDRIMGDEGEDE